MFVPYDLDSERPHSFQVHRSGDRCVCGCSAIITSSHYPDSGYCPTCSKKREEFINLIVGDITLGKKDDLKHIVLSQVEQMRKFMISERLYFVVDSHFSTHDRYRGNFVEPYEEPEFIIHCLCEKLMASENLLETISEPNFRVRNKFHRVVLEAQYWYLGQVRDMFEIDLDNKNSMSAEKYGYSYSRKFPNFQLGRYQ